MHKNINDKTTVAAYRVFETLKYLIKKPASVSDIVNYLEKLDYADEKGFSKSVVYKYLTTLKFVGINIINNKCKYEVKNLPFKINFTDENIKALAILNNLVEMIPEKELSDEIVDFFYQLKMRYSLNSETFECNKQSIKATLNIDLPSKEQLVIFEEYEKYCKDKLRLQITYYSLNGELNTSIFEPLEVKYDEKQVILKAFCTKTNTFFDFKSKQIANIIQTPLKCHSRFFARNTLFKLKGKLAKRYTLRSEEQIFNIDKNGYVTVSNKSEPKEDLCLRLMRYFQDCEIISSKEDKEFMIKMIDETLKNYEGT